MIIILTQCFPSRVGGIESLVSNLAMGLSSQNKVIVFADRYHLFFDAIYDNQIKDKFIVRRASGLKFFRRRKKIKDLKPFILSNQVRCVIGDSWKSFELCIDLLNNKKIPTICLAHGNEIIQKKPEKLNKVQTILNKCSVVVANSNYTLNLIKKNLKINQPILKRIYPGAASIQDIKEEKVNIDRGDPMIITLARLEKRKGHIYVLNAIQNLIKEFKNLKYVIAGEGNNFKFLKEEIKRKKLDQNVYLLGKVNDAQKKYIFSKTDLMVMPTIDDSNNSSIEGFGISYIEAALYGIPSIASNIGGTSEAVIHNKTGIIINNMDELEIVLRDLLLNKEKRQLFGEEAKKRAYKEFQWNKITNEYINLISNIQNK